MTNEKQIQRPLAVASVSNFHALQDSEELLNQLGFIPRVEVVAA